MNFEHLLKEERYAELQDAMQQRYLRNMEFFQEAEPEVYKKVHGHISREVFLVIDDNGQLNLSNGEDGQDLVYKMEPRAQCRDYLDEYFKRQRHGHVTFKTQVFLDEEDDVHITSTNKAVEIINSRPERHEVLPDDVLDCLFINGVGIGYILEEVGSYREISNLIICERYNDILAAAMHVVDFKALYDERARQGKTTKIFLDTDPERIRPFLMMYLMDIGLHNYVNAYIINHIAGEVFNQFVIDVLRQGSQTFETLGFFDDEQWSLSHTVENLKKSTPFVRFRKQAIHKPIFVIANGPSIDQAKDFLIENRDKAIYVACGSTLGTLSNLGIKPDINIELERRYLTPEIIKETTTEEYRKGILFVGSNVVHPDTFDLFDESVMFIKPNDLGSLLISECFHDEVREDKLHLCTPNVGNAGLSLALSLGGKRVFLLGMDCAYGEQLQHHSEESFHNSEGKTKEFMDDYYGSLKLKEVDGNLKDKVKTDFILGASIRTAERCIRLFQDALVVNMSDGARIKGAIPAVYEKIELPTLKSGFVESELFDRHKMYDLKDNFYDDIKYNSLGMLERMSSLIKNVRVNDVKEARAIVQELSSIIRRSKDDDPCVYQLMKGSVYTWLCYLVRAFYKKDRVGVFNDLLPLFDGFLSRASVKITHDFERLDDKVSNLF